jgi:hypothetical protein
LYLAQNPLTYYLLTNEDPKTWYKKFPGYDLGFVPLWPLVSLPAAMSILGAAKRSGRRERRWSGERSSPDQVAAVDLVRALFTGSKLMSRKFYSHHFYLLRPIPLPKTNIEHAIWLEFAF